MYVITLDGVNDYLSQLNAHIGEQNIQSLDGPYKKSIFLFFTLNCVTFEM